MQILFNKKTLEYNKNHIEGAYRIGKFPELFEETPCSPEKGLQYLELLYSKEYIGKIKSAFKDEQIVAEVETKEEYFDIACISVDLAVQAGEVSGFAITRPPGHHASKNNAEGFCFFNNLAISVMNILNKEPKSKICIVDIDGHHGNGTQKIFEHNSSVLYCSLHQESTYPFSGFLKDQNSLNFPLSPGTSDDILKKVTSLFKKKIDVFEPDYIAISAGFDGYFKDALLSLNFSKKGFYELGKIIRDEKVKTFCCLEGGYHDEIPECVEQLTNGLEGKEYTAQEKETVSNPMVLREYIKKEEVFKKTHKIK